MKRVADQQHPVYATLARPLRHRLNRGLSRAPFGADHDRGIRDAVSHQVLATHSSLADPITFSNATGHHHCWGEALLIQGKGVVQPSSEYRRRLAVVLGRAQDNDGINGAALILSACEEDREKGQQISEQRNHDHDDEETAGEGGHGSKLTDRTVKYEMGSRGLLQLEALTLMWNVDLANALLTQQLGHRLSRVGFAMHHERAAYRTTEFADPGP